MKCKLKPQANKQITRRIRREMDDGTYHRYNPRKRRMFKKADA